MLALGVGLGGAHWFEDRRVMVALARAGVAGVGLVAVLAVLYVVDTNALLDRLPAAEHGRFLLLSAKTTWLLLVSGGILIATVRAGRAVERPNRPGARRPAGPAPRI